MPMTAWVTVSRMRGGTRFADEAGQRGEEQRRPHCSAMVMPTMASLSVIAG